MNKAGKIISAVAIGVIVVGAVVYSLFLKSAQYSFTGEPPRAFSESLPTSEGWLTLFDGKSLEGWTPKFTGYPAGENFAQTWQVRDGSIIATYENYPAWNGEFGNLFYEQAFSSYVLQLEYRFVGEQVTDSVLMSWARQNSGVMFHSEGPKSMHLDQNFPVSIEAQLLGADLGEHRPTGNVCTPDTHIVLDGKLHKKHCTVSLSKSYSGDQWVELELEVHPDGTIRHFVNGLFVLEYKQPLIDTSGDHGRRRVAAAQNGEVRLNRGYIALQSESHPVQFRNIRLYPLRASSSE
ncbi:MAG: hypothetical protein ACI9OO_001478 [Bacteroidia bacterium]|jgi:hypothetical protein